jgi:NAD(P)-dependent dehydrogenase (short-subunit alcohol dehydrogenase family)
MATRIEEASLEQPGDFRDRPGAVLVSGGSGGLGAEICRLLAARGADVALSYRGHAEAAERVVAEVRMHGSDAHAWETDLASPGSAREFGELALRRFGAIHTVIHAAGPHVPQLHLSKVDPVTLSEHLQAEAGAFFNLVQPLLPELRERSGAIVAVTTAATRRFPVRDGLSAAPKAAVETLARGLAAEEGRFGIRVNCVGPGMLTDGMSERLIASGDLDDDALAAVRAAIPLGRFGRAADVAEAVCFLASDRAAFISGQMLDVDGGYAA